MWNSLNATNMVIKNIFPFNANRIIYVMFCKPITWAQIHANAFLILQMFDRFSKKFQVKTLFIRWILYDFVKLHFIPLHAWSPTCRLVRGGKEDHAFFCTFSPALTKQIVHRMSKIFSCIPTRHCTFSDKNLPRHLACRSQICSCS